MEVRPNPVDDNSSIPQQHQHHAHAAPSKQLKAAPNPVDTSSVSQRSISYSFSPFLLLSVWLSRKLREVQDFESDALYFGFTTFFFLNFLFGCGENWGSIEERGKGRKFWIWCFVFLSRIFLFLSFSFSFYFSCGKGREENFGWARFTLCQFSGKWTTI